MFKVRPSVRQKDSLTLAFETILSVYVTELSSSTLLDYYCRSKKGIISDFPQRLKSSFLEKMPSLFMSCLFRDTLLEKNLKDLHILHMFAYYELTTPL